MKDRAGARNRIACARRRIASAIRHWIIFGQRFNRNAVEQLQDALMYFSQRFFYGATARLVAAVVGKAGGQDNGAIDGADDLENADVLGIASDLVAAIGDQIDLSDQFEYIIANLEANKKAIIQDLINGA